jgi:hypothetical protein
MSSLSQLRGASSDCGFRYGLQIGRFAADVMNELSHSNVEIELGLDSSVGIALGYGLEDRCSRFRFPAGAGNFSLHHRVRNGSGVHPACYPMGTRGSFPGGKAAGA